MLCDGSFGPRPLIVLLPANCSENKCVQLCCKDMFCCREIKRFLARVDITVCDVEILNKFLITLYYTLYSVFKVSVNFEEN